MTKLYTNTDVSITLTPGTGFVMADVVSAEATFTLLNNAGTYLTLTSDDGDIVLGASDMTVNIPDTNGISTAGVYDLRITITDTSGNIRGLTPSTETLRFW